MERRHEHTADPTLWRIFVCSTDCNTGKRVWEQPERFDDVASDAADNNGKFEGRGAALCWLITYITHAISIRYSVN